MTLVPEVPSAGAVALEPASPELETVASVLTRLGAAGLPHLAGVTGVAGAGGVQQVVLRTCDRERRWAWQEGREVKVKLRPQPSPQTQAGPASRLWSVWVRQAEQFGLGWRYGEKGEGPAVNYVATLSS